jgi:hypothetical protein
MGAKKKEKKTRQLLSVRRSGYADLGGESKRLPNDLE